MHKFTEYIVHVHRGALLVRQPAQPCETADPPDTTWSKKPQLSSVRTSKLQIVDISADLNSQNQLAPFAQHVNSSPRSAKYVSFVAYMQTIYCESLRKPDRSSICQVIAWGSEVDVESVDCATTEFVEPVSGNIICGNTIEVGDACVADVHCLAIWADADAIGLAKSVFNYADGASRWSEAESLRTENWVVGDVDRVAVPGVREKDIAPAVNKEVVWAAQLLTVVVVQKCSNLACVWIELVDSRCLVDGTTVRPAWKREACFHCPVNFAFVELSTIDSIDWRSRCVIVNRRLSAIEIDDLLLENALMRLREDDSIEARHIDWCLMDTVVPGIKYPF